MFFTSEDSRAKIQGSRDPLGMQPIWSFFGRRIVSNLTTVTTSIRGFSILLLGRYFGGKAIEECRATDRDILNIFLRMEQLGAYARYCGPDAVESDIRGIERVKRFVAEGKDKVEIDDKPSCLILSDQKTYGLWGLYSTAARISGLIPNTVVGLTEVGKIFVENEYMPRLRAVDQQLMKLLTKGGYLSLDGEVLKACKIVLKNKLTTAETDFFSKYLRDGEYAQDRAAARNQAKLASLMKTDFRKSSWTWRQMLKEMKRQSSKADDPLALDIGRILAVESVLAPAGAAFDFLQTQSNQKMKDVIKRLADEWPAGVPDISLDSLNDVIPEIRRTVGDGIAELFHSCAEALNHGNYTNVVQCLIRWNQSVMEQRGASPWMRICKDRLDVKYRGEGRELPKQNELAVLWRNSYFVDALWAIAKQLEQD